MSGGKPVKETSGITSGRCSARSGRRRFAPWRTNWERLGELLGDEHDLFLLGRFVAETCAGETGEVAALDKLIVARQKKLARRRVEAGFANLRGNTRAAVCARLGKHVERLAAVVIELSTSGLRPKPLSSAHDEMVFPSRCWFWSCRWAG